MVAFLLNFFAMKSFILNITLSFLCLIVFFNDCHSQNYHPMPFSNAVWREYGVDDPINLPNLSYINEYYLDGNTLIGNFVYQRVRFYTIAMSGDTFPSNDQFFYRQDTVNKKVYIQNIFEPFNDTLIYDFDVDLGDTLHNILYFGGNDSSLYCCIWVDQIDSIQTIEGKPFPLYKK